MKPAEIPTSDQSTLVQIRDLHFSRGRKAIFRGLNMDLPRGQITTIMGPSGTGKTTLLKMIGGQLKPSGGQIHVDNSSAVTYMPCENDWACYFSRVLC